MQSEDPEIRRLRAELKEAWRQARERSNEFKRDMEASQRRTARAVRAFALSMESARRDTLKACAQLPWPVKRV